MKMLRIKHERMECSMIPLEQIIGFTITHDPDEGDYILTALLKGNIMVGLKEGKAMDCHSMLNKLMQILDIDAVDVQG